MLKKITMEEFEDMGRKRTKGPIREFAEDTVREFLESGESVCEVTGWPGGEASDYETATYRANVLRQVAAGAGATARQRKLRAFIMKEENDG